VRLTSVPSGATFTDERIPVQGARVTNRYESEPGEVALGIRPGHHRITARLEGYQDAVWEFDAAAGPELTHTFELQPVGATDASPPATGAAATGPVGSAEPVDSGVDRPTPTSVYLGLGATGVFAVAAGVTGMLALGKAGDFDDSNDGMDPGKAKKLKSDTETMNLVTDVFLGAAVLSAGVTAILYFTRPTASTGADQGRLSVSPVIGPGAAGMTVSGAL
jgi:hypothetical protein